MIALHIEIQLLGGEVGPMYEEIISRTQYVSAQTENKTRIVACGVSLAIMWEGLRCMPFSTFRQGKHNSGGGVFIVHL